MTPSHSMASALHELNNLKSGWLEGTGIVPQRANLERLSKQWIESFPQGLEEPKAIPTAEGNVSFEWIKPALRMELEVNFTKNRLELRATDIESDTFMDESFDMSDWAGAFARITLLLAS